ncbi:hypothetical protein ACKWTF_010219 [Chironomus riparius]
MNFKILLLLLDFKQFSCTLIDSNFKDQTTLSIGIKLIAESIIPDIAITFNSISTSDDYLSNDFLDTFMKIIMNDLNLKFRQQSIEKIGNFELAVPRKSAFVVISNFSDFKKFFKEVYPINFSYNVHLIIAFIDGKIPEVQEIFKDLWKVNLHNVIIIFEDQHEQLSVVTFFPFQSSKDCSNTTPIVINKFINRTFTHDLFNIFPKKMENLHQCEIKVATSNNIAPHIYTKIMPDGSEIFYGRDFELISTLSSSLKFKLNFSFVSYFGCLFELEKQEGVLTNILNNKSDLVIANCWLRLERLKTFDVSTIYFADITLMAYPLLADMSSFEKLFYPLDIYTWILLMAYLIIGIILILIIKRKSMTIQNFVFGRNVQYPYLNMIIGLLGTTQHKLPGTNFARFLLMNFLILSLIIRTGYQGRLYQLMQANIKGSEPQTLMEMREQGYTFHSAEVLSLLTSDSDKFKVIDNGNSRYGQTR